MNYLTSIQNLLQFINDNWTSIIIIIGLSISIAVKIKGYIKLSKEEKINIAKQQIKETMLKLVTDAEEDYYEWVSAGSVKRAQVIEEIFTKYPVLSKVANQEELIIWLDETIDNALKTMREVLEKQPTTNTYSIAEGVETTTSVATSGYIQVVD